MDLYPWLVGSRGGYRIRDLNGNEQRDDGLDTRRLLLGRTGMCAPILVLLKASGRNGEPVCDVGPRGLDSGLRLEFRSQMTSCRPC